MIWNMSMLSIFASILFVFIIAIEIGFRLGRQSKENASDETMKGHVSVLQNALLGLLALLIGFTFSMSIARYDMRKALVVEEANAISTLYGRAQYLPAPEREKVPVLIKSYLDGRLEFYNAAADTERLKQASDKTRQIQGKLQAHMTAVSRKVPQSELVALFAESLNEVFDVSEKQHASRENHVPEAVIILLFSVSTFGMGFIGYGYGFAERRRHGSTAMFALLIAIVLSIVLDIDRPQRGFVKVSQASLLRLQEEIR